jgi:hypothetical protein
MASDDGIEVLNRHSPRQPHASSTVQPESSRGSHASARGDQTQIDGPVCGSPRHAAAAQDLATRKRSTTEPQDVSQYTQPPLMGAGG